MQSKMTMTLRWHQFRYCIRWDNRSIAVLFNTVHITHGYTTSYTAAQLFELYGLRLTSWQWVCSLFTGLIIRGSDWLSKAARETWPWAAHIIESRRESGMNRSRQLSVADLRDFISPSPQRCGETFRGVSIQNEPGPQFLRGKFG